MRIVACAALLLAGCESEDGPRLPIATINHWSMPTTGAMIPAPRNIHVGPDGAVYVLDDAGRVLVFDAHGKEIRQWNMPESSVGNPEGLCTLADGRIAVADTHYHRVVYFDAEGNVLQKIGSLGEEQQQFIYPVAIVQDDSGFVYIGEYGGNDRIQKWTADGEFVLQMGAPGTEPGQFQRPSGIVWDEGHVYVADAFNDRIQVFRDTGEFVKVLDDSGESLGLHYPYDIAKDDHGELIVVEYGAGRVTKLDRNGRIIGRFGSIGSEHGQFETPWGLAWHPDGAILVGDTGNRRIVELLP